jgi:PKD repeat protein
MLNLYQWSWGDGTTTANQAVTTHTYPLTFCCPVVNSSRQATVTLTVQDRFGRTNTATKIITVIRKY